MGMLTRKQQWRRTRTRNKQSWGDFPPEVLEAMLGGNGAAGMIKSVSWDHSYTVGSRQRADQRRTDVNPAAKHDDANVEPNSHPSSSAGSHGIPEVHIPRSVSCSSLAEKRTLFPRSSSGDGLGTDRAAVTGTGSQIGSKVRHRVLHRRGVRFDTQVKMVLIPKREEFTDIERARLWWGRDDYLRFRQVLIDWKGRNAHRISRSDNILSIDLSDLDGDEEVYHDDGHTIHAEAVRAADATAAAAAAAAAAKAAAAVATKAAAANAASTAAAAAAAAAAATAVELAASNARDDAAARTAAALVGTDPMAEEREALAARREEERKYDEGWGEDDGIRAEEARARRAVSHAAAVAIAVGVGGSVRSEPPYRGEDGSSLSDITEEDHEQEESDSGVGLATTEEFGLGGLRSPRLFGSFSHPKGSAGAGGERPQPDWYLVNSGDGMIPLRRAFSIGQVGQTSVSPRNGVDSIGRLKAVPLSERQAMVESLRAWRQSLDSRIFLSQVTGVDGEVDDFDERGRSMSLQEHSDKPKRMGRSTAILEDPREQEGIAAREHNDATAEYLCGRNGYKQGTEGGRQSSTDDKMPASASSTIDGSVISLTKSGMTFEKQQREEEKLRREVEAAEAARAAATVRAAAEVAYDKPPSRPELFDRTSEIAAAYQETSVEARAAKHREGSQQVVEVGLNDSPGSVAAAAAVGIRMAAEGVSSLSLRARDSVENLQDMAEQAWSQVPLSSSA